MKADWQGSSREICRMQTQEQKNELPLCERWLAVYPQLREGLNNRGQKVNTE